jgi:DNA repair protein RecO (recombination protein O)
MRFKTLAVPFRCVDYSNSSQIVSFFTREFGPVDGIAKGSHREKNSFQGPFDLAVAYEMVFLERRSAGLAVLTEAVVLDGFRGLRTLWERHVAASHVLEFLRVAAAAGGPEPGLFDLLCKTLRELAQVPRERVDALLVYFDTAALRLLGLLPSLEECVECNRPRPTDQRSLFISPRARGIVCKNCRDQRAYPGGVALPRGAVRVLDNLAMGPHEDPSWPEIDAGWQAFGAPVVRVVSKLRTELLERELVLRASSGRWVRQKKVAVRR